MSTWIVRGSQERIVPDVSVDAYRRRGWTVKDEPETSEAPATSDVKAEWVDYAVSQGIERDEAQSSTKAELIERLDG